MPTFSRPVPQQLVIFAKPFTTHFSTFSLFVLQTVKNTKCRSSCRQHHRGHCAGSHAPQPGHPAHDAVRCTLSKIAFLLVAFASFLRFASTWFVILFHRRGQVLQARPRRPDLVALVRFAAAARQGCNQRLLQGSHAQSHGQSLLLAPRRR